jgi:hypothetical protein
LQRVLAAFDDAGIQTLVLKGVPLSFSHYGNPALRPRGDADILVRAALRARALALLEQLGYRADVAIDGDLVSYQLTHEHVDRYGTRHCVDLHWRISNSQVLAQLLADDELFDDAVAVPGLGPHARAPSAVHALLFACMHRAGHVNAPYYVAGVGHHGGDRLIWLYDIHLLLSRMDAAERARFCGLARSKRMTMLCRDAVASAQRAFGTGAADHVLAALPVVPGEREASSAVLRHGRIRQLLGDLRALPSWSERMRMLAQHALPSRRYMESRFPDARLQWLPVLHARRLLASLRRRDKSG